jgi:hypothetical protein
MSKQVLSACLEDLSEQAMKAGTESKSNSLSKEV